MWNLEHILPLRTVLPPDFRVNWVLVFVQLIKHQIESSNVAMKKGKNNLWGRILDHCSCVAADCNDSRFYLQLFVLASVGKTLGTAHGLWRALVTQFLNISSERKSCLKIELCVTAFQQSVWVHNGVLWSSAQERTGTWFSCLLLSCNINKYRKTQGYPSNLLFFFSLLRTNQEGSYSFDV